MENILILRIFGTRHIINKISDREALKYFVSFIHKLSKYKFEFSNDNENNNFKYAINDYFDKILKNMEEKYNIQLKDLKNSAVIMSKRNNQN